MSDYTESRNEQMIKAIINDTPYSSEYTQGRNEQILQSIIDNTPYTKEPESRMEVLLLELKAKIEGGGGEYQAKSVMPDFTDGDVIITPDPEYSALSSVTVEKDTDLIAGNIKKDVEIFGVTGTYEMPADIETDMNAVLNKKMGTSTTYAPNTWADTVNLMGKLPEKTASGAIASFNDGADDVPIVSSLFDIVAQQAGSGDPAPDNVRPISGFTGCNIVKAGKNLWSYGNISGTKQFETDVNIPVGSWAFSCEITSADVEGTTSLIIFYYDDDTSFLTRLNRNSRVYYTFTATKPIKKMAFYAGYNSSQSAGDTFTYSNIQLEVGSTATTYEPYTAATYAVDWTTEAGTVYGGTLNATTGVLTVTSQRYNLADLTWTVATQGFYQATKPEEMARCDASVVPDIIAEKYIAQTGQWVYAHGSTVGYIGQNGGLLYVTDSTTPSGYIVAPLITPQTYQLTPTQIKTLLGANNIYCDTGDSSVTYRADIDLALQNL